MRRCFSRPAELDAHEGRLLSSLLSVCLSAADSLGCRDGGWCGGVGEAGSGADMAAGQNQLAV